MHPVHHTHRTRRRALRSILAVAFVVVGLAACGDSAKVGDESLLDFKEQVNEKGRLGERTTTTTEAPVADEQAGAGGKAGIQDETTTTAAPTTTTTEKKVTVIDVSINGDNSGTTQFNPSLVRVFVGTVIKWTNSDEVARSIDSDDGETFESGPIAPGGVYTYTATKPGKFNYHDGTRPYAVGRVDVLAR